MKSIYFKTNVKCGACVAAITPEMDKLNVEYWEVDLSHPDRILEVKGEISTAQVQNALKNAGYQGESVDS